MKLVREHINEKFTEDSDPIDDLGLGLNTEKIIKRLIKEDMKHYIFEYSSFESGIINVINIREENNKIEFIITLFTDNLILKVENDDIQIMDTSDKYEFVKKLIKDAGLDHLFNVSSIYSYNIPSFTFIVNPYYKRFFEPGRYKAKDFK